MKAVNIAFAFDHNYYRQASVAIASLLDCAKSAVSYNIYCLCADDVSQNDKDDLTNIVGKKSSSSRIYFIDVTKTFDDSFEIRGITKAAYFRLLLHKFLPDVDRIIYSDVDVLFKDSLIDVYKTELGNNLLGVVKATAINLSKTFDDFASKHTYWKKYLSDRKGKYFNSGFLLMNLKEIRRTKMENKWLEMTKQKFFFQDQDILNITCKNRVLYLPAKYVTVTYALGSVYEKLVEENVISREEFSDLKNDPAVLHWAGEKPWNKKEIECADEWWAYVRRNTSLYSYFLAIYLNPDIKLIFDKNKPISIVFFSHSGSLGGAERSLFDLISGLKKLGILCSVIFPCDGPLVRKFESISVATYIIPSGYSWWAFNKNISKVQKISLIRDSLGVFEKEILPIVNMINPDFIYSQTIVSPWGAMCATRLRVPHILSAREYGELDHGLAFYFGFKESMRSLYEDSEIVFSVTDDVKNTIFEEFKRNQDFNSKCVVIGSSIHIPPEFEKIASDFLPRRLSKEQTTHILMLGNIFSGKGQLDAVLATAKLKKDGYDVKLKLVGGFDREYVSKIREEINKHNIQDVISIEEYVENGLDKIIKSDIVLSCSKREALGRVLFEAVLLSRPIIYSNSGGSKDSFTNNVHGFAYRQGDHIDLAEKISSTIDFPENTRVRIENAKNYVLNNFNDRNYVERQRDTVLSYIKKKQNLYFKNNTTSLVNSINYEITDDYVNNILHQTNQKEVGFKQAIEERDQEIDKTNEIIKQKNLELYEIRNSLRWKIPNYLYKLYRNKVKKFVPKTIFRVKDFFVFVIFKLLLTQKRISFKKIRKSIIKSDPTITIGIASYNHSKYLKQCIESALSQDYKNYDILIVDDNSPDPKNREILKEYEQNEKISILYKGKNEGISASLNDQVINAKNDWIAFMDCDDYLPQNALSRMAKYIKSYPEKRLVFSNRIEVDENNNELRKVWFGNRAYSKNIFHELMKGMVSSHLKLIHKDVFLKVGLFDDRFGGTHDYDMYLKVAFYLPETFGYVDEYLYYHRIHSLQNTIVDNDKHKKNVEKMREEFQFREQVYGGNLDDLVSIVILSFNRGDRLKKTISKINYHAKNIKKEIIIWDNNSSDKETLNLLKELQKQNDIKVIFSKHNLKCSGGRKEGSRLAKGEFVIFLDNDVEIQDGTIEELVIRLHEDHDIVGACCRLLFPDEKIQYNGGIYSINGKFISFDLMDSGKNIRDLTIMRKRNCDWIPGGATIFRRRVFSKHEHDIAYLNAFEDNDFSFAITNKQGSRVVNCPTSVAVHFHVKFEMMHKPGTWEYLKVRSNNDSFIKSWARFYEKWNLIIKDDFIMGLAGLAGNNENDVELYLQDKVKKY